MTTPEGYQGDSEQLRQGEIWVLIDGFDDQPGELSRYAARKRYSVEALGEKLQEFTKELSQMLSKVKRAGEDFELSTVSVDVRLNAEVGFELIAKAGIAGGITLTFTRAETKPGNASST